MKAYALHKAAALLTASLMLTATSASAQVAPGGGLTLGGLPGKGCNGNNNNIASDAAWATDILRAVQIPATQKLIAIENEYPGKAIKVTEVTVFVQNPSSNTCGCSSCTNASYNINIYYTIGGQPASGPISMDHVGVSGSFTPWTGLDPYNILSQAQSYADQDILSYLQGAI